MILVELASLEPGARFALIDDDGVSVRRTGTLIYANDCRARVRYDADGRHVELADGTAFDAPGRPVDIAARTEVRAL